MIFQNFPRLDMLVPWRVFATTSHCHSKNPLVVAPLGEGHENNFFGKSKKELGFGIRNRDTPKEPYLS